MPECLQTKTLLATAERGDLGAAERAHIEGCDACARQVASVMFASAGLAFGPAAGEIEGAFAEVGMGPQAVASPATPQRPRWWIGLGTAAAVCAAFLLYRGLDAESEPEMWPETHPAVPAPAVPAPPAAPPVAPPKPAAAPKPAAPTAAAPAAAPAAAAPALPPPAKRATPAVAAAKPSGSADSPEDSPVAAAPAKTVAPAKPMKPAPRTRRRRTKAPAAAPSQPAPRGSDEVDDVLGALDNSGGRRPAAAADPLVPTQLSRAQILRELRRVGHQVRACGQGKESGVLMLSIVIEPDGTVSKAAPKGGSFSVELTRCVTEVVKSARFPKAQRSTQLSFPFRFSKPE